MAAVAPSITSSPLSSTCRGYFHHGMCPTGVQPLAIRCHIVALLWTHLFEPRSLILQEVSHLRTDHLPDCIDVRAVATLNLDDCIDGNFIKSDIVEFSDGKLHCFLDIPISIGGGPLVGYDLPRLLLSQSCTPGTLR